MFKKLILGLLERTGYSLINSSRIGVNPEWELARLTAQNPIRTILDVGGNFGQTALRFAEAFPAARIFTVEPAPDTFASLLQTVKHEPRIHPLNLAVGEHLGRATLHLTPSAGTHTLLTTTSTLDSIEVPVSTLDSLAVDNKLQAIDLLKIDVEGFELQVLEGGAGLFAAERIRFVLAECVLSPDSQLPHTDFFELHKKLTAHGFCCVAYYAEAFALEDGCALGNVLYGLRAQLPKTAPGRLRNITPALTSA